MAEDPTKPTALTGSGTTTRRRLLALWSGGFREFALPDEGSLDIGRSVMCKLCIDHPSVSRRHLVWHASPDAIEDCGSSNGTRMNGERVPSGARLPLRPGDTVEIGKVVLVFEGTKGTGAAPREGAMGRVRRLVELTAPTTMTVLLLGETGVGKDVLAEWIHAHSPRASGPLVRINCAALSETLLESELFGHEKGAFTGAVQARAGHIEAADGGTLLLDEVGEIPLSAQAKLLVALERREVLRVGSTRPRTVDVRFLAATNRELDGLVAKGAFRADLLHRLNGVTIRVPPLRERTDEIEPLAREFAQAACRALGKPEVTLAPNAVRLLAAQPYPGNIRELKSLVERATAFATGGVLDVATIELALEASASAKTSAPPENLREELETLERQRILQALEECHGNQTKAAMLLGMPRRTLVTRLASYARRGFSR
jgi:DNA-binding NtrC family response regulator